MSNDVYLIQKQTLDNIVFAVDDVVMRAGGLTPEEIVEQLDAIPRRQSSDCTITNNVVRVPEGLFQDYCDITVPTTSPDPSGIQWLGFNNAENGYVVGQMIYTQPTAGWIAQGESSYDGAVTTDIPAKTAQIYTPGTTNQTIASGVYLAGAQTIMGDADLVAGNIKSGVQIFGVTGTYTGAAVNIKDSLSITPSASAQTFSAATDGYDGYASVSVSGDSDLTAANIKSGVNIFGVAGTYTSDATATAARMLSGYTAYAKGAKITGTIATKTSSNVSVSGRTVTIPAGYYASQVTKSVGTAVAGTTYTPGTTDEVLAAGSYLTGAYTIKGDADLIASNIKSGVEIFGVTGTYEGTGGGSYLNAESYTF